MVRLGDRVFYVGHREDLRGATARVIALDAGVGKPVGIEFDAPFRFGHECDGAGTYGRCWWARSDEVRPV